MTRKLTAEQKAERAANLPRLLAAAERAVAKGWFIFPAIYGNKIPFKNSNAQKDAKSGPPALKPWTVNKHPNPNVPLSAWKNSTPANPCLLPSKSGLIVVDVDKGLKSVDEALEWTRKQGRPKTYTVVSGRNKGDVGLHFYFRGVRDVRDVNNPIDILGDGVLWEIRYNSYVVIAGGLHKNGNWYKALDEAQPVAPVPEFIQTYTRPKEVTRDERGNPNVAGTVVDGKLRLGDLNGKLVVSDWRHDYLRSVGGKFRRQGGNEEGIFTMMRDVRDNLCENPSDISLSDEWLRKQARWLATRPIDLKLGLEWTTPKKRKRQQTPKGPLIIHKQPDMGRYPLVAELVTCLKGLYGTLPMSAIKKYIETTFPFPVNDKMIYRALQRAGWRPIGGRKHRQWQSPGTDLSDHSVTEPKASAVQ